MALEFAHGAIQWLAADGAATVYTVSGLSFQPKAIRFYWFGLQSASDALSQTTHLRQGVGFALGTSDRRCVGSQSQDAAGTQVCTTGYRTDCVAMTLTSTPAMDGALDLNSITSDGFTCIVDDVVPANITVFWEAWGGSDIKEFVIGEILEPAATGTVDYTLGFPPDVVMFASVHGAAAANTATRNDATLMVAAMTSPAKQWVFVHNDDDASATSDTDRFGAAGGVFIHIAVGGGNAAAGAALTGLTPAGFRLNWTARVVTSRKYIYLAIRGGSWDADSFTIAGNSGSATTTVVTKTRGGVPFTPKGISFCGHMAVAQTGVTSTTQGMLSIGSATSTSDRRSQGVFNENANATAAEINHCLEYDSCLSWPSATGTLATSFDIDAMNVDGFRVIVDTAGGVASQLSGYLACGNGDLSRDLNNYQFAKSSGMSMGERIR